MCVCARGLGFICMCVYIGQYMCEREIHGLSVYLYARFRVYVYVCMQFMAYTHIYLDTYVYVYCPCIYV